MAPSSQTPEEVLQGNNAHDFRAAMDGDSPHYRTHDLLLRFAILERCNAGCHYQYMGDSGRSTSRAKFKERFGGRAYHSAEYRRERLPITAMDEIPKKVVKSAVYYRGF